MTRTRRFLGGLRVGYASQALMTLVGFWLVQFLLDMLGQELYGLWLVGGQLLAYLALLDLGVVALLPRQTAWATGAAQRPEPGSAQALPDVLGNALRVVFWQTPLVALVSVALWLALPEQWAALRGPLGVVLIAFTATFPLRVFEASLRGLQDLSWVGLANLATWAANMAAVIGLVLAGWGLYALAAGWVVGRVGLAAAAVLRLKRRFPQALPTSLPRGRAAMREILGRGIWISVSQISSVLLTATDLVLIGAILGPVAAVPYALTAKLITALAHFPQALVQTAGPGISEVRAGESQARLRRVTRALAEAILLFSGALFCVVLAVNEGFVVWWVGTENWGGMTLSVLVLARVLIGHWVLSLELALFAFGRERRLAVTGLAGGTLTVGVGAVLISTVGVEGAPAAAIAAAVLVSAPAYLGVVARETGATALGVLAALWPWAWRFALAALVAGVVVAPRVGPTIPELAAGTIAAGLVYALLLLPRLAADPLRIYLHPRLVAAAERLRFQRP